MRIHKHWFAMFAGDDTEYAGPIMRKMLRLLAATETPTVDQVAVAFTETYQEQRARVAEEQILGQYGLTMNQFSAALITDDNESLRNLKQRIERLEFSLSFLVCGFDKRARPHIFAVTNPGLAKHYDHIGFWSIGSGSDAAINNLLRRKYRDTNPLGTSVYLLAESKYVAESYFGVGEKTAIFGLKSDGTMMLILRRANKIREIWINEGQPPMPENLDDRLEPMLRFHDYGPIGLFDEDEELHEEELTTND